MEDFDYEKEIASIQNQMVAVDSEVSSARNQAGVAPGQPVTPQHRFAPDADERTICISGLPLDPAITTPENIFQLFQDCGPIEKVTVVRRRATGELKGYAYVEFATHQAAGRALDTKNNLTFNNTPLKVSRKRNTQRAMHPPPVAPTRGRGRGGYQPPGMAPQGIEAFSNAIMALMTMGAAGMAGMRGRGGPGFGRGGPRGGRGRGDGGHFNTNPFQ
jgi:hypothetical protein